MVSIHDCPHNSGKPGVQRCYNCAVASGTAYADGYQQGCFWFPKSWKVIGRKTDSDLSNEDLYPVREQFNQELFTAVKLLEEGVKIVNESIEMLLDNDLISSDDSVHKFQALLPELFCCRALGDSFGAVVNSIFHSIGNMDNNPMNEVQLRAILKILKRIHSEPFIEYGDAVEEILQMEEAGLEVSPPHLKYIADLLNG